MKTGSCNARYLVGSRYSQASELLPFHNLQACLLCQLQHRQHCLLSLQQHTALKSIYADAAPHCANGIGMPFAASTERPAASLYQVLSKQWKRGMTAVSSV